MQRFIPIATILLSGCSGMSVQEVDIYKSYVSKPTFEITCPTSGCNFTRFAYYDPNKELHLPTNGYDTLNNLFSGLTSVVLGVAPYYAISSGFKYMSPSITTTNTTTDSSTSTKTFTNVSTSTNQTTLPMIFQKESTND